jgi:2-iminobutanoate/2-iminopropanoate deaminase
MRVVVTTVKAPAPIGPYSQGVVGTGRLLFVAGQTPKDPKTGQMPKDFAQQVERCLENVKAIVLAGGATMQHVVKVNVYLKDLSKFATFNEIYSLYFQAPYPARTTIGAALPGADFEVEIDAIAALP